ncbi:hypothetical protein K2F43_19590 [Clostridium estertheticum]|uniref:hypothetical protein n=1 Tax=Clostridium estertheticum TaxID=238834 RepID=UPI001C6DF8CC|nr:hypothetical protein [Clostridium estertheticum]MBW9173396.1 hypothetical protein [Clostridium estertheticum]WLC77269.1 hypothetical protein KTC99_11005 [Clostridium estertheticum]
MNEVQKSFKKQMKQSLKELKMKDVDAYHEYLNWNHLDDSKSRLKKESHQKLVGVVSAPFKILFKFIGLVMIIGIGYNFIKGLNNQTQSLSGNIFAPVQYSQSQIRTTNQKQIIKYLNFIKPIIININQDIELRNRNMDDVNKKLITRSECINNSMVYKNRINNNITEISSTDCPKVLESYQKNLLNQYSSLIKAMNNEIEYFNSGNDSFRNEVINNIEDYKTQSQDVQTELNNVLKENNLK